MDIRGTFILSMNLPQHEERSRCQHAFNCLCNLMDIIFDALSLFELFQRGRWGLFYLNVSFLVLEAILGFVYSKTVREFTKNPVLSEFWNYVAEFLLNLTHLKMLLEDAKALCCCADNANIADYSINKKIDVICRSIPGACTKIFALYLELRLGRSGY